MFRLALFDSMFFVTKQVQRFMFSSRQKLLASFVDECLELDGGNNRIMVRRSYGAGSQPTSGRIRCKNGGTDVNKLGFRVTGEARADQNVIQHLGVPLKSERETLIHLDRFHQVAKWSSAVGQNGEKNTCIAMSRC